MLNETSEVSETSGVWTSGTVYAVPGDPTMAEDSVRELLRHGPREIAVAVLHNKNKPKGGCLPAEVRHYFVGQELEDRWICYPWDALDIGAHERQATETALLP